MAVSFVFSRGFSPAYLYCSSFAGRKCPVLDSTVDSPSSSSVAFCPAISAARSDFSTAIGTRRSLNSRGVSSISLLLHRSWMSSTGMEISFSRTDPRQRSICISSLGRCRAEVKSETDVNGSSLSRSNGFTKLHSAFGDEQTVSSSGDDDSVSTDLVGEEAAVFNVSEQKTSSWISFTLVLGVVLAILYVIWLDPNTGYGGSFINALASINSNHEVVMLEILFIFALVHSGGASLRAAGEKVIGERAYRVLFAGLSLPLAVSAVVYFINHRYDGLQLWQVRTIPGVHEFCWILSFVSFLLLYPSTFNLLEVAAVDKPKLHLYETGIMRITRHPQMVGQLLWCLAHTLWIGNSFTLTTSVALLVHHLFGVWHGDRRLAAKYGESFEIVKKRTSVIPFAAILEGRQKLPEDYYKEFLRLPYYVIVGLTIGAYISHPYMQLGEPFVALVNFINQEILSHKHTADAF